ncbi:unnamed protein product [Victoria cruziana]
MYNHDRLQVLAICLTYFCVPLSFRIAATLHTTFSFTLDFDYVDSRQKGEYLVSAREKGNIFLKTDCLKDTTSDKLWCTQMHCFLQTVISCIQFPKATERGMSIVNLRRMALKERKGSFHLA